MSDDGLVYCYNVLMRLQHIDLGLKRLNENIDLLAKSRTEKKPVEDVDVEGQISNLSDDSIDKEVSEKLSKEVVSNIIEQLKRKMDNTIEERAKLASEGYEDDGYSAGLYMGYIVGAKEQNAKDISKVSDFLAEYFSFKYAAILQSNCDDFVRELCKVMKERL